MCVRKCVRMYVRVYVRVCVCVCARARALVRMCVCVCELASAHFRELRAPELTKHHLGGQKNPHPLSALRWFPHLLLIFDLSTPALSFSF